MFSREFLLARHAAIYSTASLTHCHRHSRTTNAFRTRRPSRILLYRIRDHRILIEGGHTKNQTHTHVHTHTHTHTQSHRHNRALYPRIAIVECTVKC